jgi:ABC-type Fe3+/spermidine/putrescine transport system ATPase subunit
MNSKGVVIGGMAQRAALARALINHPTVLLLTNLLVRWMHLRG